MMLVLTFNAAAVGASLLIGFATGWWIWKDRWRNADQAEDRSSS